MFLVGHDFVPGRLCKIKRVTRSSAIAVTDGRPACRSTIG